MLLAQKVLLHFSHAIARKFIHDKTALWNLEVGQFRFQPGNDLLTVQLSTEFGNDHRHPDFAEIGMRHAHQCALGHARNLVDVALDLSRIHVVAAADDQVLAAPDDRHVTERVDLAYVAGLEPAVAREFFLGLFGHAPIAFEDIRAGDLDAADLACGQLVSVFTAHAHAHAGQGKAHRAAAPLA